MIHIKSCSQSLYIYLFMHLTKAVTTKRCGFLQVPLTEHFSIIENKSRNAFVVNHGEVGLIVRYSADIQAPGILRQCHQVRRLSTDIRDLERRLLPDEKLLISSAHTRRQKTATVCTHFLRKTLGKKT